MSEPSTTNPDVQIGTMKPHIDTVFRTLVAVGAKVTPKRRK